MVEPEGVRVGREGGRGGLVFEVGTVGEGVVVRVGVEIEGGVVEG